MEKSECKYFEECSAPLCPEDGSSLENGCWFPDEEICRKGSPPEFVRRQKRIAKKLDFDAGCFTKKMLEQKCKITSALKGIDPDKGCPHDLEDAWLKKHPAFIASEKMIQQSKKNAPFTGE